MKKLICFILTITLILWNGCIEKKSDNLEEKTKREYIVYNIEDIPKDLIMLNSNNIRQKDLLIALFEGLVSTDEKGNIIPALAESWEINKDYTFYSFKIRENAYWSNGDKITSKDFKKLFDILLNNNKINNDFIINSREDSILEIKSIHPCTYLLDLLSEPVYRLRNIDNKLSNWKVKYNEIKYTGAFKIDSITNENEVILTKNNYYWGKNNVKSNKLKLSFIKGSENALANFKINNIDFFENIPLSEKESLTDSNNIKMFSSQIGECINFNLYKKGIVRDINFRKAISLSINRSQICSNVLKNTVESALAYVPYDIKDGLNGLFRKKNYFSEYGDVQKAKEYLNKSNYFKNREKIVLIYVKDLNNKRVCQHIKEYLKSNLNIDLELKEYDESEILDAIKNGDYDLIKTSYNGECNYPSSFLEKWTSYSNFNKYGYNNNKYDKLIEKANIESNKFTKKQLLQIAENTLMEDYVTIPLYFKKVVLCKKENINGLKVTKIGNIDFTNVYIKYIQ
ncbi:dipeptide-binding protein DppE precursor [Clostridium acetireducens DSM 10703]|uniref:Dipeptide-binding protein DppE n=1 Tax=Clostridium acetireducens DSM 10703 TaxID=1121290 RepID=A0A1E8EZU9_9CLOT|nr:peptide ABC transporter substrate-binding protein [Clostridium acetireducens]OFI06246.1 dipeptide-binding protein DppE precursor [Clostridium acetireducens DSM 10703]